MDWVVCESLVERETGSTTRLVREFRSRSFPSGKKGFYDGFENYIFLGFMNVLCGIMHIRRGMVLPIVLGRVIG